MGRLKIWNAQTNTWDYVSPGSPGAVQTLNNESGSLMVYQTLSATITNPSSNFISGSTYSLTGRQTTKQTIDLHNEN